jgi:thioredoxin-related protein
MSRSRCKSGAPILLRLISLIVAAAVAAIPLTSGLALQHIETAARHAPQLEVVVIESLDCIYCELFRRNVLSSYENSPRARHVPLRFLDLEGLTARKLVLVEPISVVPTVLVLRDNEEVGRIPGYVAWDEFFHSINYLLARER